ncbi:MAG: HypC/HybG/HupF family hydrogenase formation chaperone [Coriobacteriia bacterium]
MCLAIPAKVIELESERMASVDIMGVTRKISTDLVPSVTVGDYVLVHAGFAIQIVDEQYAEETLDLLRSIPELIEEDLGEQQERGVLSEEA